jgi:hypothetical protein
MTRSRPYSQPRRAISTSSSPRTRRAVPPVSFTVKLTALTAAAGGSAAAVTPSVPYPALWPWVTVVVILIIVLAARRPALRGVTVSGKTACSIRVTQRLRITGPVT